MLSADCHAVQDPDTAQDPDADALPHDQKTPLLAKTEHTLSQSQPDRRDD